MRRFTTVAAFAVAAIAPTVHASDATLVSTTIPFYIRGGQGPVFNQYCTTQNCVQGSLQFVYHTSIIQQITVAGSSVYTHAGQDRPIYLRLNIGGETYPCEANINIIGIPASNVLRAGCGVPLPYSLYFSMRYVPVESQALPVPFPAFQVNSGDSYVQLIYQLGNYFEASPVLNTFPPTVYGPGIFPGDGWDLEFSADPANQALTSRVMFSTVTAAGQTSLLRTGAGPAPPSGYGAGTPPWFWDVSTSATYTGPVTVCLSYAGLTLPGAPALFHYENGGWVYRTTSTDAARSLVCGDVTSLDGKFAVFAPQTKLDQTILVTTPAPGSAVYGSTFTVAATAPGGPVSYGSAGACTNAGAAFTMTSGTGTCTVDYNQAGNADYNAAPQVSSVTAAAKANQSIAVTTPAPGSAVYGSTFTVAATAPGGPVSYGSAGACTNAGAAFTMTRGTGTCTVDYNQAGNADYNAAPQVSSVTAAAKANQSIVVTTPAPGAAAPGATFTVAATAPGGPVSYGSAGACSNAGPTFTITGTTGTCNVFYNQAGNDNYNAAAQATNSVTVQSVVTFTGFLAPVSNPPVSNLVTAGAAVPVKFSLGGNQGLNIFAPGYPASQATSCASGEATSAIEQTASPGASTLSYDATSDIYTYVWKTDKAWKGTCRLLTVTLTGGASRTAKFQFR